MRGNSFSFPKKPSLQPSEFAWIGTVFHSPKRSVSEEKNLQVKRKFDDENQESVKESHTYRWMKSEKRREGSSIQARAARRQRKGGCGEKFDGLTKNFYKLP